MNSNKLIAYIVASFIICFVMYIVTAIFFAYQGINLHEEAAGILALIMYFFIPLISLITLDIHAKDLKDLK